MVASDAPVEPTPPPTPFERDRARRRLRRRRRLLVTLGLAAVAIGAALVVRGGAPDGADQGPRAPDGGVAAEDAVLLDLLGAVDRAEAIMLDFNEASRAALGSASSQEAGLAAVAGAATAAVADLEAERAVLDLGLPDAAAEDVRVAYLPHLDAWIAYLAAVADDPTGLFAGPSDPAILRINATARTFVLALTAVLDAGVGPEVEALGRGILEEGFPAQDDAEL